MSLPPAVDSGLAVDSIDSGLAVDSVDSGNGRRWWLPGPPPPRRLISLEEVEKSYRRDSTPELSVPVSYITVGLHLQECPVLARYLACVDQPAWASMCDGPMYLFHGCGNVSGRPEVAESFARRGPSIRFSRAHGYFSAGRAVYWSDSVEFAIAWSFFSETGSWDWNRQDGENSNSQRPFRCLVFVSRIYLAKTSFDKGLYLIPQPETVEEEDALDEWCEANTSKNTDGIRIPPPKSQKGDWGVIGSRISRSTIQTLRTVYGTADRIRLFAACNEASSRAIAEAGVEILHITFEFDSMPSRG